MWPDWSREIWVPVVIGSSITYAAGLACIWAAMTYFFGRSVGKASLWLVGIPLWIELAVVGAAFFIAVWAVLLAIAVAAAVVLFAVCGVFWVLTWPWAHRYRRLFREYIGFDPNVKGYKFGSKWERKVNRRLKELAIAFQDALDRRATEGDGSAAWSLSYAVNQTRKSFGLARKAAHECGFWVKRSHKEYLPKRRRERETRRLQAVN